MDPRRGAPLGQSPASVTVVAGSCAEADAWATALMVMGPEAGSDLARQHAFHALFLLRSATGQIVPQGAGSLFAPQG
jgi:thiamine biosynthesis lipoprotein